MGGMCSSSEGARYATSNGDSGGTSGGAEEAKVATPQYRLLKGLHSDSVTTVSGCGEANPTLVASGSLDKHIIVNDFVSGEVVHKWKAHDKAVNQILYANAANRLVSCSRDLSIRVWQLGGPTPLATMTGHTTNVVAIDVSTDNTQVYSGARDTTVRVWDVAASKQVFKAQRPRNLVTCLKAIPSDGCIAVGAEDLAVRVWDPRSGALRVVQEFKGYTYFPLDLDVSADSHYIVTSSKGFNSVGGEVRVWDRRTGKEVTQFSGHKQDAVACRIVQQSPMRIATASKDMTVKVWQSGVPTAMCQHMETASGMFTSLALPPAAASASGARLFGGSFGGGVFVYGIDDETAELSLLARTSPDQEARLA